MKNDQNLYKEYLFVFHLKYLRVKLFRMTYKYKNCEGHPGFLIRKLLILRNMVWINADLYMPSRIPLPVMTEEH